MKTLITDGFENEEERDHYDDVVRRYRTQRNKEMTDVAKVLDRARQVYRIRYVDKGK